MALTDKIEALRNQLNRVVKNELTLCTEEIVTLSQKLDALIDEYYKLKSEENRCAQS